MSRAALGNPYSSRSLQQRSMRPRDPKDRRAALNITSENERASQYTVTLSIDKSRRSVDDNGLRYGYIRGINATSPARPSSSRTCGSRSDAQVEQLKLEVDELKEENMRLSTSLEKLYQEIGVSSEMNDTAPEPKLMHEKMTEDDQGRRDEHRGELGLDIKPLQPSAQNGQLTNDDVEFAADETKNVDSVRDSEYWNTRSHSEDITTQTSRSSNSISTTERLSHVEKARELQSMELRDWKDKYEGLKIRTDFKPRGSAPGIRDDTVLLRRSVVIPTRLSPPRTSMSKSRRTLFDTREQMATENARSTPTRSSILKLMDTRKNLGPKFNPWGDDEEALEEDKRFLNVLEKEKERKERQRKNILEQGRRSEHLTVGDERDKNQNDEREADWRTQHPELSESLDLSHVECSRAGRSRERHSKSSRVRSSSAPRLSRSKKAERRKSITIPEPFSFDQREAEKRKSISKRRFEQYVAKIKAQEEMELSVRFRANPIPATTLIPLYDEMLKKRAERSEAIRSTSKIMTKSRESPFSFAKRDEVRKKQREKQISKQKEEFLQGFGTQFKANPVPDFIHERKMHKFEERDRKRAIQSRQRALEQLTRASLPPRMAKHHRRIMTQRKMSNNMPNPDIFTFQPQITRSIPDFELLQNEFEQQLAKKKKAKGGTAVEPFSFDHSMNSSARLKVLEEFLNAHRDFKSSPRNTRTSGAARRENHRDQDSQSASYHSGSYAGDRFLSNIPLHSDSRPSRSTRSSKLREKAAKESRDAALCRATMQRNTETMRTEQNRNANEHVAPSVPRGNLREHYRRMEEENRTKQRESMREEKREQQHVKEKRDTMLRHRPFFFEDDLAKDVELTTTIKVKEILQDSGLDADDVFTKKPKW